MNRDLPSLDQWRQLYTAAIGVRKLAPWDWLSEADIFGVQSALTGELAFVSVMGGAGDHFSVALYLGEAAVHEFLDLEESISMALPPSEIDADVMRATDRLLEIPNLQASFENREVLEGEDRGIIRQLGLKFRGRNAWPMFRSYRPGFFPWLIDSHEAELLSCALEQVLVVAPRLADDPSILDAADDDTYLVRMPASSDAGVWSDRMMLVPGPEPAHFDPVIDDQLLAALKRLPRTKCRIQVGFFPILARIQSGDERPSRPYALMLADAATGAIVGMDILQVELSLEQLWLEIPERLIALLLESGTAPAEIVVDSERMAGLLAPLSLDGSVALTLRDSLLAVNKARASLDQEMGGPALEMSGPSPEMDGSRRGAQPASTTEGIIGGVQWGGGNPSERPPQAPPPQSLDLAESDLAQDLLATQSTLFDLPARPRHASIRPDIHAADEAVQTTAYSYTNRKGKTYYLHRSTSQAARQRYYFSPTPGDNAIDDLPEGYEVRENVNGQVSAGRSRARIITLEEE